MQFQVFAVENKAVHAKCMDCVITDGPCFTLISFLDLRLRTGESGGAGQEHEDDAGSGYAVLQVQQCPFDDTSIAHNSFIA